MPKLGTIRKSRSCPPGCKETGCFEKYEKRKIFGKTRTFWKLYCKRLEKAKRQALKLAP